MKSNFEHQKWLYLGMHAPCGHGKNKDLWLEQTTQKTFKTSLEQTFENKETTLLYKGWPRATELQQYLYRGQKLDFHFCFPEVN